MMRRGGGVNRHFKIILKMYCDKRINFLIIPTFVINFTVVIRTLTYLGTYRSSLEIAHIIPTR